MSASFNVTRRLRTQSDHDVLQVVELQISVKFELLAQRLKKTEKNTGTHAVGGVIEDCVRIQSITDIDKTSVIMTSEYLKEIINLLYATSLNLIIHFKKQ